MAVKAETITQLEGLEPLRQEWDELQGESGTSVFTSHLWTSVWLKHFHDLAAPRVLAFRERGELVGMAPLAVHRARLMGYPVTYLCLVGNVGETTEYHDLGLPFRGAPQEAAAALLRGMRGLRWNMLQLRDLRWDGLAQALFERAGREWPCEALRSKPCPFVTIDPDMEILAQFEVRSSRKVRRIIDSLEGEGRICFRTGREPETVSNAVDVYVEQHRRRWASKGGSIFREERQEAFLRDIACKCAERGEMLVYEVLIDGRVAAQQFCILDGRVVRLYKIGMDDDFRPYAPGYLSVYYAMKGTQEEGYIEYDLGPGPEDYKYKVGGVDRWTYNIQGKRGSMVLLSKASRLPGVRGVAAKVAGPRPSPADERG